VTRFRYAPRSVILVISAQSAVMAGLLTATCHPSTSWFGQISLIGKEALRFDRDGFGYALIRPMHVMDAELG
jgi:hypothetical protein